VVDSARPPKGIIEQMDLILMHVSDAQQSADEEHLCFFEKDYPVAFAAHGNEFRHLIELLVEEGMLTHRGKPEGERMNQIYRPTLMGLRKIEEMRKAQAKSDQAFVAMRFNKEMFNVYEKGIKPALEATGWRPFIANFPDEERMVEEYDDKIDDLVIGEIRRSSLFIADLTGQRQNVYFETGLAMGLGINIIRTCREDDIKCVHFDERQRGYIDWTSPEELQVKLEARIRARGLTNPTIESA
jgi:nucleoside 2-deoxyribosyltransferase